jgi:VWFA-related protein
MTHRIRFRLLTVAALSVVSTAAQQNPPAAASQQTPTVKTTTDEVLLDLVVRDKKGKPVTDLKRENITVNDNGAKQNIKSFRLVSGSEAISENGGTTKLDPLRQLRLVTFAFEALDAADRRKLARTASLDLIQGDQGTNVFYSVVVVNTRLLVLQPFTNDKAALAKAIDRATNGQAAGSMVSESESIQSELKRQLGGQTVNGADQDVNLIAAATDAANTPMAPGGDATKAVLARVMLDMLRMDAGAVAQGTRMSLSALESLVQGLRLMPGRKSILYFTQGLYVPPELDVPFHNVMSMANRANVTFYAVDTRGVMTSSQNAGATSQLNSAARASATTVNRTAGAVTKDEVMSSDNAEVSARSNLELAVRDLAESTGGFLIGDSNDLRGPLRHVNEEIASYYELSFNPGIQNYDGSFRKLSVSTDRKDLVIHARNGYFALPPEAVAMGLQPFEMPLLKALSDGAASQDVAFHAGAVRFQPKADGTSVSVLVEVPLRTLQATTAAVGNTQNVHFSLAALVKDSKGEVVQKLTRDRSFQVTADQLKMGNFIDKMAVVLAPGKYTLESVVMDRESGKIGTQRSEFTIDAKPKGVGISSLTPVRSYTPNAKGLDANEPFQFQGGSITPTLDDTIKKSADAALRLFFTVYQDSSISAKPAVEIQFLQNGKSLTAVPLELPAADAQGRIPYVMTIPAAAIPAGSYEVRAIAKQGDTVSQAQTVVKFEAM